MPTPTGRHATVFTSTPLPSADRHIPCKTNHEVFFDTNPHAVAEAKELCGGCRLRAACLEGALRRREPWGVWGGELLEWGHIRHPRAPRDTAEVAAVA